MDKEVVNIEELIKGKNEDSSKKFNFMKLFSSKYLKIIILCVICLVAFILFLNVSNNSEVSNSVSTGAKYNYTTTMEYCTALEKKLESVLSQINGAGNVSVMLSVEGSPELVYAVDSDTKVSTNNNGSTTTSSSSPIIVQTNGNSSPLILTENLPIVKGVIIVSSGANNMGIKLDILSAVSKLLDISTEKISVLKGI